MSIVTIDDTHLKDIANTIRSKNETETKYKPSEMSSAINELVNKNYYIDGELSKNMDTNYLLNRLIIRVPYLETSHMTNFSYAFQRCSHMVELQEIDAGNMVNINQTFASCSSLENFGGLKDLGKAYLTTASANYSNYTLNLTNCEALNHESLMNVINKVYDIKSLGIASQTIRVSAESLALLSEEEIAIATAKGWNITT